MEIKNQKTLILCLLIPIFSSTNYSKVLGKSNRNITCSIDQSGTQICQEHCNFEGPYGIFLPRPQGLNSAAIVNPYLYQYDSLLNNCEKMNFGYRYSQTIKGERIATSLFAGDKLEFQGSLVKDRSDKAIVSDWFGLDPLHSGSIEFDPKIKQHHLDFGIRLDLGKWKCNLEGRWLAIQTTLVHANWNLRTNIQNETTDNKMKEGAEPNVNYPLYMSAGPAKFSKSLKEVLGGDFTFGDMQTPWKYGKFDLKCCGRTDTKLANIDFLIGHDFCTTDDRHFSIFLKTVAPTGTKLDKKSAQYIFNPIIGNGHHWEFGAGINSHCDIYRCDDTSISIHLTGSIAHLFSDKQWRTFDFKKYGPLSRYMLLKELTPTDKTISGQPLGYNYTGNLLNSVNFTTQEIKSSFRIQGEASLQFIYQNCNCFAGLGYNIYGRSQEKIKKVYKNNIDKKIFGMKGNTGTHFTNGKPSPINTTQTNAENLSITNVPYFSYNNIDNGFDAFTGGLDLWDKKNYEKNENLSGPAIPISSKDLDIKELPTQIIHKFFAHADYRWNERCKKPSIGIYYEYDLVKKLKCNCNYATPSQWSIGIRGGFSF